jgi:hypothetical protein
VEFAIIVANPTLNTQISSGIKAFRNWETSDQCSRSALIIHPVFYIFNILKYLH